MLVDTRSSDPDPTEASRLRLCDAAKLATGLAAVALPFARSRADEAERWLRILRLNGAVGQAMQAIGVPEHPLVADASTSDAPCLPDSFDRVISSSRTHARERGADAVTTEDLLFGVGATYGEAFEHALAIRATTSKELIEVLQRREQRAR